ncbi:MAG: PTS transporter subunit EIIA [Desulfobacteraceae bacterium]|nr:PTS transporter subunit EIIA [Desulfobacteraceae bacterium]
MKLTIDEIARRLELNLDTLERWIRQGRIPVKKRGNDGIFNEPELKRWAVSQRRTYTVSTQGTGNEQDGGSCMLATAMEQGGCFSGVGGSTTETVLKACVDLVPGLSTGIAQELYTQLLAREELISTGVGKGVAIPHPRNPLDQGVETPMIITCFLEKPVDFKSIDDLPVFVLFLLLNPSIEDHLNLLSRLSYCLREDSFVRFLKTCPNEEDLLDMVKKMEATIESKGI